MRLLGSVFGIFLVLLGLVVPVVRAEETPEIISTPAQYLLITEVYPNPPDSTEVGTEYIRLTNPSEKSVSLAGYGISLSEGASIVLLPDNLIIQSEASLLIYPVFGSLLNGGAAVSLYYPAETALEPQTVTYPSFSGSANETKSWQYHETLWQKLDVPTDSTVAYELELHAVEPQPQPAPAAQCNVTTVILSEVLPNPVGADSDGGEFIELQNIGTESVSLTGCMLATDKGAQKVLTGINLAPGGYHAEYFADSLYNESGKVTFISAQTEEEFAYGDGANDDDAWAVINDTWVLTTVPTPNAANQPTPPEEPEPQATETAPCPAGKLRNPETNRCKTVAETASSLLPCGPGQSRNPATNRCRKITSATISLTPCQPGQKRNPATNRCRKVTSANSNLSCPAGQERNLATNRCRKVAGTGVAGVATFNQNSPSELNSGVLIIMAVLALGYGAYEYRLDVANWVDRLRTKRNQKQ